jgi:diguanylate cyclase
MTIDKFSSFSDFESTSRAVLSFLHNRLGFELWMVTRTEGDDWIVLQSEDHGYGVKEGDVFRWADSFCSQMVQGLGPCIAPKSGLIPAYASAPIGKQVNIGAYVGVPISDADGSLFGTLCAIDPKEQPDSLEAELPLIELLGRMLSCLLVAELKLLSHQRRTERNFLRAALDLETGLMNQIGWDSIVKAEERRCHVYGHPACVIAIRLMDSQSTGEQEAAVKLAAHVSRTLKECLGPNDSLARIAPQFFAIMGPERNLEQGNLLAKLVVAALSSNGIATCVGIANRDPRSGMRAAFEKSKESAFATNN